MISTKNNPWPKNFPPKEDLRKDIDIMISCFMEVLFKHIKKSNIYGVYFKGSALKRWDSIIDYVPGISDIDIHFILKNSKKFEKMSLDEAFDFSSELRDAYKRKNKNQTHFPVVQMNLLNILMKMDFYSPTPKSAIKVVYGKEYPYEKIDLKKEKAKSIKKIMDDCAPLAEKLPLKVIDKAGRYEKYLQDLAWKISPSVPNYLFLEIKDYDKVWSMNRTEIARILVDLGEKELSKYYVQFYAQAWNYYMTKSEKSLVSAIKSGYNVLNYLTKNTQKIKNIKTK